MIGLDLGRERHDQRSQQFALAGPRGAGDQAVRAVAYQVDVDDSVRRAPDRGADPGVGSGGGPPADDLAGVDPTDVAEANGTRHSGRRPDEVLRIEQRRQATRRPLRRRSGDAGEVDRRFPERVGVAPMAEEVGPEFEHPVADGRDGCGRRGDDDAGGSGRVEEPTQRPRARRQLRRRVGDDEGDLAIISDDVADAIDIDHDRGLRGSVWQPVGPRPLVGTCRDDDELPVGRTMGRRELHDEPTYERSRLVEVAVYADHVTGGQVDRHGDIGEPLTPVDLDEQIRVEPVAVLVADRRGPSHGSQPERRDNRPARRSHTLRSHSATSVVATVSTIDRWPRECRRSAPECAACSATRNCSTWCRWSAAVRRRPRRTRSLRPPRSRTMRRRRSPRRTRTSPGPARPPSTPLRPPRRRRRRDRSTEVPDGREVDRGPYGRRRCTRGRARPARHDATPRSSSASTMLPPPGVTSRPCSTTRNVSRLAPTWSDLPAATTCGFSQGTPSRREAILPVSCVKTIEPSAPTSMTAWVELDGRIVEAEFRRR